MYHLILSLWQYYKKSTLPLAASSLFSERFDDLLRPDTGWAGTPTLIKIRFVMIFSTALYPEVSWHKLSTQALSCLEVYPWFHQKCCHITASSEDALLPDGKERPKSCPVPTWKILVGRTLGPLVKAVCIGQRTPGGEHRATHIYRAKDKVR